jgi:ADP-heptose:LPS heptosyltransferase
LHTVLDRTRWRKIIVFRTDRLGDLVLSLPVVEAIKAALPAAQVDLFVHPHTVPIARLQRNVSCIVPDVYTGFRGLLALTGFLRSQKYDLAIHLFPVSRLALATFRAGVPVRAGTIYRYFSFLFNRRIRLRRWDAGMHERDLNLKLIEGIGIPVGQVSAGLEIPNRFCEEVLHLLAAQGIDLEGQGFVVIHPGSGDSSLNWPAEHFGELGKAILERGIPVVLTGSDGDRPVVDRVKESMGKGGSDLCGQLDLEHLAALLWAASLVVSNSTGPLHLADALGTKVIGLYSPYLAAAPHRWGPYGQPENVFVPDGVACRHCSWDKCEHYNCLATILPETVLERALEFLATRS